MKDVFVWKIQLVKFLVSGNELMKKEDYTKALECYTEAIKADRTNAVYYCNRYVLYEGKTALCCNKEDWSFHVKHLNLVSKQGCGTQQNKQSPGSHRRLRRSSQN